MDGLFSLTLGVVVQGYECKVDGVSLGLVAVIKL